MLSRLFSRLLSNTATLDEPDPMKKYLIAGLGNIGPEYANTRHNIGFQVVDRLAGQEGIPLEPARLGEVGTLKIKGRSVLLLKPSTFMNRSGKALQYWLEKEKIPLEHLLVVTDDLNLPFGTLRLKTQGSDGGHNGLRDIQAVLNTAGYARFRFGIGAEYSRGKQVDYVLGSWNEDESAALPERLDRSAELLRSFVLAGPKLTMNTFNGS